MSLYGAELPEVSQKRKIKRRTICLTGLKKRYSATSFIFIREFDNGNKITIMVNNKIVSLYGADLPEVGPGREIKGGPLYGKDRVLELLAKEENIRTWTRKCTDDLQIWSLELEDVAELIRIGLGKGKFLGSELCEQKKNGPRAACDAYRVFRLEWSKVAYKKIPTEYYIKFAINKTGKLLLMVSCHPSSAL